MRSRIGLSFAWLCVAPLVCAADGPAAPAERVTFTTTDGVEVVGDYYAPTTQAAGRRAPCAILIHMFPAERTSWQPLAPSLLERGFAVLAYDIRGTGESVLPRSKYLRRLYADRDPKHFASAWRDAEAAVAWLRKQKACDATHVVLIGASVGCSIAIDYAGRNKDVAGVICLSPGVDYMGLDSRSHIRKLGERRVLLMAPEGERDGPRQLAKVDKSAVVEIKPGGAEYHATRMFNTDYGPALMRRIGDFAADCVAPSKNEKP